MAAHTTATPTTPQMEILTVDTKSTLRGGKQVSAAVQGSQIINCKPVNEGKQLELTFADQTRYRLHTAWIKDCSPANTGKDYYRKSAADVWALGGFRIAGAQASQGGHALTVEYAAPDGSVVKDEMNAKFLHSFAPF